MIWKNIAKGTALIMIAPAMIPGHIQVAQTNFVGLNLISAFPAAVSFKRFEQARALNEFFL